MATAEIKPPKTVASLVEAIWQNLLPQGFDMNKLPHSIREVYDKRGRLEGYELHDHSIRIKEDATGFMAAGD